MGSVIAGKRCFWKMDQLRPLPCGSGNPARHPPEIGVDIPGYLELHIGNFQFALADNYSQLDICIKNIVLQYLIYKPEV